MDINERIEIMKRVQALQEDRSLLNMLKKVPGVTRVVIDYVTQEGDPFAKYHIKVCGGSDAEIIEAIAKYKIMGFDTVGEIYGTYTLEDGYMGAARFDRLKYSKDDVLTAIKSTHNEGCFSDKQIDLMVDFVNDVGRGYFLSLSDIFISLFTSADD